MVHAKTNIYTMCIDTGDDGLGTSNAAITLTWILSVLDCKCDDSACFPAQTQFSG